MLEILRIKRQIDPDSLHAELDSCGEGTYFQAHRDMYSMVDNTTSLQVQTYVLAGCRIETKELAQQMQTQCNVSYSPFTNLSMPARKISTFPCGVYVYDVSGNFSLPVWTCVATIGSHCAFFRADGVENTKLGIGLAAVFGLSVLLGCGCTIWRLWKVYCQSDSNETSSLPLQVFRGGQLCD